MRQQSAQPPVYQVRERLHEELGKVTDKTGYEKVAGIWAFEWGLDPKVHIGDYGPLQVPLHEDDARYLIHSGHQALFGKEDETVIDGSVRKPWELNADQFELRNTQWPYLIQDLCRYIACQIGVNEQNPGFHAELYKMLLYEPGAMVKSHQDTEKVPGMFGTLVVCLPSPHIGGGVVTHHNGLHEVLQTSSAPNPFIWWYSDIYHEVLPVQRGMRWVLTYNLVRDNSTVTLPIPTPIVHPLKQVLQAWEHQVAMGTSENTSLVYLLGHEYTEASLKLPLLKGLDLRKAAALKEACDQCGFLFYLAFVENEKLGSAEDGYQRRRWYYEEEEEEYEDDDVGMEEIFEDEYSLTAVYDEHGQKIAMDIKILHDDLTEYDPFDGQVPYRKEYGNLGRNISHWHRSAVSYV
ncbi:hypothetical protein P280DRAFT_401909 [Massarina eburnea CBS 473.64]|uniref:Prolyl 4-hydroxylase alpha subunit Fe(2+) 2OG dioxygenase domain-containing protein n=1 Tax=Massarina eburnea CBS 473.64 TaxID=1395130 RepID=A0A6A6RVU4_9PLEO|nr:hypothetical protein P280DRAFT_401909 [Massarina eburnea CBS 473.64]